MPTDLILARPLWELSVVLFVLGLAARVFNVRRAGWWQAQGLLMFATVVSFAAAEITHKGTDLLPVAAGIPVLWLLAQSIGRIHRATPSRDEESSG